MINNSDGDRFRSGFLTVVVFTFIMMIAAFVVDYGVAGTGAPEIIMDIATLTMCVATTVLSLFRLGIATGNALATNAMMKYSPVVWVMFSAFWGYMLFTDLTGAGVL